MSDKTIAQKLLIKEGHTFLLLNAPRGYKATLGALPPKVKVLTKPKGSADIVQAFVTSKQQLAEQLIGLRAALAPQGILWITYPKGTASIQSDINRDSIPASIQSDINRDSIRAFAAPFGLEAVAICAVDDDWSALRLKVV